jgi:hypothetical protein
MAAGILRNVLGKPPLVSGLNFQSDECHLRRLHPIES